MNHEVKITLVIDAPDTTETGRTRRFMLERATFNHEQDAREYAENGAKAWRHCVVTGVLEVELTSRMVWFVRKDGTLG